MDRLGYAEQGESSPSRVSEHGNVAGGLGSGAMQLLATAIGAKAGGMAIDFITKAAAGTGGFAHGAVANYRGNMDPVTKIGVHVGMPVVTIPPASQMPHPHSMVPLIKSPRDASGHVTRSTRSFGAGCGLQLRRATVDI